MYSIERYGLEEEMVVYKINFDFSAMVLYKPHYVPSPLKLPTIIIHFIWVIFGSNTNI